MFDDLSATTHGALSAGDPAPAEIDTGFPPSEPGALLAAVGLPSRAIREVLGNPPGIGADG